jgi:hypothetical protein
MTPFVACTLGFISLVSPNYWEPYMVDSFAACYNLQKDKRAANVQFEYITKPEDAIRRCGVNLKDCKDLRSK